MKALPPKRRGILYGGIVLIITCFFIFTEPFVDGHFLSTWLRYGAELSSGNWKEQPADVEGIEAAIRKAGPKAIPVLLEKIDARDAPWKRKLDEWQGDATWLPDWTEIRFSRAEGEFARAYYGFSVLGPQAAGAIPELSKRLNDTNVTWLIVACLDKIGLAALPALKSALTNQNNLAQRSVLLTIGENKVVTEGLLPEIRMLANHSDPEIARYALFHRMRLSPTNEAVELVHAAFRSTNEAVLNTPLSNLRYLNLDARQFVPDLSNLLAHPTLQIRRRATNVLKQVDSAAAFAAGVNTNPPVPWTNAPRGPGRRR